MEIDRRWVRSVDQRTPIADAEVPRYDPEHCFVPPEEQVRGGGGGRWRRTDDQWNEEEKQASNVSLVDHLHRICLYAVLSLCDLITPLYKREVL